MKEETKGIKVTAADSVTIQDCYSISEQKDRREKIRQVIKPLAKHYVLGYIHNLSRLETELKRVEDAYLGKIIALFPDIEKGKLIRYKIPNTDEERTEAEVERLLDREQRIEGLLDVTENELGFCEISNHIPFSSWQALKGD